MVPWVPQSSAQARFGFCRQLPTSGERRLQFRLDMGTRGFGEIHENFGNYFELTILPTK
jgi:hypothetical protein